MREEEREGDGDDGGVVYECLLWDVSAGSEGFGMSYPAIKESTLSG